MLSDGQALLYMLNKPNGSICGPSEIQETPFIPASFISILPGRTIAASIFHRNNRGGDHRNVANHSAKRAHPDMPVANRIAVSASRKLSLIRGSGEALDARVPILYEIKRYAARQNPETPMRKPKSTAKLAG